MKPRITRMARMGALLVTAVVLSGCTIPVAETWYDGPLKRADGSEVVPPSYQELPPMPPVTDEGQGAE